MSTKAKSSITIQLRIVTQQGMPAIEYHTEWTPEELQNYLIVNQDANKGLLITRVVPHPVSDGRGEIKMADPDTHSAFIPNEMITFYAVNKISLIQAPTEAMKRKLDKHVQ